MLILKAIASPCLSRYGGSTLKTTQLHDTMTFWETSSCSTSQITCLS